MAYFPIRNITTYTSNWTIKARVIEKSPLRQLKADNCIFHVDVVDVNGDVIRVKFWGKAATKWDEYLEKGKVYTFSKGNVELSNKRFNNTPHNYELTCHQESIIELADDDGEITTERFHKLLSLRDIKSMANISKTNVDVLCIVKEVGDVVNITTRAGNETCKRSLMIVDNSGYEMELVLWGETARLPLLDEVIGKPIIASQLAIREWQGGRSCSTGMSSEIKLATQDNVKEKEKLSQLEQWYEQAKEKNETFMTMKPQTQATSHTYEQTDIATLLTKTKGNFIINAKLRKIHWKNKDGGNKLWYYSCPVCAKKVIMDEDSNKYKCIACGDAVVTPLLRYFFFGAFIDYTGKVFARIGFEVGEKIMGRPAKELEEMSEDQLKNFIETESTHKDYKVSGYLRGETYNGETRYQLNVTKIEPLDYALEAQIMLENMQISYESVLSFLGIPNSEDSEDHEAKRVKLEE